MAKRPKTVSIPVDPKLSKIGIDVAVGGLGGFVGSGIIRTPLPPKGDK